MPRSFLVPADAGGDVPDIVLELDRTAPARPNVKRRGSVDAGVGRGRWKRTTLLMLSVVSSMAPGCPADRPRRLTRLGQLSPGGW